MLILAQRFSSHIKLTLGNIHCSVPLIKLIECFILLYTIPTISYLEDEVQKVPLTILSVVIAFLGNF